MTAIIIEDELSAARRLERLLEDYEIEVLVKLNAIESTISWFQKNESPDIIFLDIQLSDGLCFEIFNHVKISSKIIFVTAFSDYSIKAFDYNSISYLLKPVNKEKLKEALEKAQKVHQIENDLEEFKKLLTNYNPINYKESFTVKIGKKIKIIKSEQICCFNSFQNTTYLRTIDRNYIVNYSLTNIEADINPVDFYRVNRTFIVHKNTIVDISTYRNSRLKLTLNIPLDQDLIVSREKVKTFKNWIDE
ncbi:LytR/AlgR family response regulator transcription factor [Winogradskyella sp. PG-2]|uniref:LytR/AlgR family response regulator transcription factor n=1 Tax=Winogradskyella sp. PG-2 TaxID=754409 RepID=UPI0004586FC2|nr:response regulator transcription factor [Winogradskyella sp. PG-2]BAO75252.1 two-component system response regulator [Winogradskyella sp. PG-2]